jgi:hypothetical protein
LSGWHLALLEAAALLLAADAEPELDQVHATAHQVALKLRCLAHELGVFGIGAKAHDPLHAGAVVPAAVEQHDLATRGQVLHIALKVPLAALHFAGLFQRHHARTPRVQVLHEALDGTALAGCIAPLEQDHHALAGLLDPGLQLEQFHLQLKLLPRRCCGASDCGRGNRHRAMPCAASTASFAMNLPSARFLVDGAISPWTALRTDARGVFLATAGFAVLMGVSGIWQFLFKFNEKYPLRGHGFSC